MRRYETMRVSSQSVALAMKSPALVFLALCLLGGAAQAQVSATEPWVRAPVSAAQKATGLFVTLQAAKDSRLVEARSPAAAVVEIHEMKMDEGVMRMRALKDGLALPAGQPVLLRPGGYHVMLIGLKQPLKQGDEVAFTLVMKGADGKTEELALRAPVRAQAPAARP
jgi:periplasmic copper chaperone A